MGESQIISEARFSVHQQGSEQRGLRFLIQDFAERFGERW